MALDAKSIRKLNSITTELSDLFQISFKPGLNITDNWVTPFIKMVTTVEDALDFLFYGAVGRPKERKPGQSPEYTTFLGYQWELSTREWQDAVAIRIKDFNQDKIGGLRGQVQELARQYSMLSRYLVAEILNNGATAAIQTYDGVPLYDNAHQVGEGSFDNLLAGTGNFRTDLQTAYTAMRKFPNDKNERRENNTPTHVVVPADLWFEVRETLVNTQSPVLTQNTENTRTQGLVTPFVEDLLTDNNDWYLFRSVGNEFPFIGIEDVENSPTKGQLTPDNDVNSDSVKKRREYSWWIDRIHSVNPGHPHLHAKVVNA